MKNSLTNYVKLLRIMSFVVIFLLFAPNSYSEESNLKINILNLDKSGVLYISICKDEIGFKKTVENESEEESCINYAREIDFQNGEINSILPHGEYAISLFVDSNRNRKIDKNLFGVPKEQYGFSNNVMGRMSAPTYDQAKFIVTGPSTQDIKLRIGIPKKQ